MCIVHQRQALHAQFAHGNAVRGLLVCRISKYQVTAFCMQPRHAGQDTARSAPAAAPAAAAQQPAADAGLEAFKALIAEKRFTCTQCGKCCTGDGEVWIKDLEAENIAKYLSLPLKRFLDMHTRAYSKVAGFKMLKSNPSSETRDCTFLRPDNTCAIHPVRPLQCSTYPWWPDLMSESEWQWEKENICEGFDHPDAAPTDADEAARQLKLATVLEYQKQLAYKPSKKQKKAAAAGIGELQGIGGGSSYSISSNSSSSSSSSDTATNSSSSSGSNNAEPPDWQLRLQKLQQQLGDS